MYWEASSRKFHSKKTAESEVEDEGDEGIPAAVLVPATGRRRQRNAVTAPENALPNEVGGGPLSSRRTGCIASQRNWR